MKQKINRNDNQHRISFYKSKTKRKNVDSKFYIFNSAWEICHPKLTRWYYGFMGKYANQDGYEYN